MTWVAADVLTWRPEHGYRLWHDRAVFHFLTDPADRAAYRDLATATVTPGGFLIIATFAAGGPTHCSGLPVMRYGPNRAGRRVRTQLTTIATTDEHHQTPWDTMHHFIWLVLQRVTGPST